MSAWKTPCVIGLWYSGVGTPLAVRVQDDTLSSQGLSFGQDISVLCLRVHTSVSG
jgi:hypothetical protein